MWLVVWGVWAAWWCVVGVAGNATTPTPNTVNATPQATTTRPVWAGGPRTARTCEEANIRCALRSGCGMALQNYMLGCADLMAGRIDMCDEYCKTTLIALTSTDEGKDLMDCTCSDEYCRVTKARVEVCRSEVVLASAASTVVSCSVAHWICAADTLCATAINYYDRYCRRMFIGNRCTHRCNNSISILQRQEKAAKLETCVCDGSESFDCQGIKKNMAKLCFGEIDDEEAQREEEETNEVDTTPVSKARLDSSGAGVPLAPLYLLGAASVAAVVRWR